MSTFPDPATSGADLGAMGDRVKLVVGGSARFHVVAERSRLF